MAQLYFGKRIIRTESVQVRSVSYTHLITIKKLFISYILVNDSTIETPVSFAVEQLKTIGVCLSLIHI